jgi:Dolichyl-phosphate-mannose-protein mannosyltransferase
MIGPTNQRKRDSNEKHAGLPETVLKLLWPTLLLLTWLIMIMLVNPVGDFPLNDDWAYGYSVRALVEHGELRFSGWTATNLLGQVAWGALFCVPFGFSFTALRLSTAVLGLIGVLATYGILRELEIRRETAAVGALTVAFCPIYFGLSLTFMNDVPFAAFAWTSVYLFVRGMRLDSPVAMIVGVIVAIIAILTRQTGVGLSIAFACALLAKNGIRPRYVLLASILVAIGVAVQFVYQVFLFRHHLAPAKFNNQILSLLCEIRTGGRQLVRDGMKISFFCLIYLGLFTAPVLPFVLSRSRSDSTFLRKVSVVATAVILTGITGGLIWIGKLMPLWRNILDEGGIGPCSMLGKKVLPAPIPFWVGVTGLSVLGSVGLLKSLLVAIVALYHRLRRHFAGPGPWPLVLFLVLMASWFVPLPLLGLGWSGFYDRYTVILMPTIIATVATIEKNREMLPAPCLAAGLVLLTAYGVFAVTATHDYLAWNRTRWAASTI